MITTVDLQSKVHIVAWLMKEACRPKSSPADLAGLNFGLWRDVNESLWTVGYMW